MSASVSSTAAAQSPAAAQFAREGYLICREAIPAALRDFIATEFHILYTSRRLKIDKQVGHGYSAFGVDAAETLMQMLLPFVEVQTGHKLYPTYSFGRIYMKGASLIRHTDRPSCEVSVSVTIAQSGDTSWPLNLVSLSGKKVAADLMPGDLLLYKGIDVTHWRDEFAGDTQLQLFLHYVRQDGPYAKYKFDMRPTLGVPANRAALEESLKDKPDGSQPRTVEFETTPVAVAPAPPPIPAAIFRDPPKSR
jgi:hypothetical protein